MAKWEHWFWVTLLWFFLLLVESHLCQQIKGNGHQSSLVDLIDTLTAPTLKPEAKKANGVEPKLTIITPSSVVAVSTARPPTTSTTTTNPRPLTTSSINEANEVTNRGQVQRDDNITVSHSVSVVSVKYSFDESRTQHPETSSKLNQNTTTSNGAGLNQSSPESVESASETSAIISLSSIDQQQSNNSNRDRAPKSIVSVTTRQPQPQTQFRDENLFIQLSDRSLTTSSTTSTTSTSTTSIKEATSTVKTPITRHSFNERMKYDHLSSEYSSELSSELSSEHSSEFKESAETTTFQPPSFLISTSVASTIVLQEGIPRLIDSHNRMGSGEPEGIRSETARALNELGFTYNEYIDDSDLLGDDSNDEVIPAFHENNYHQQQDSTSEYRAIPSKSELSSNEVVRPLSEEAGEVKITSRQGKKAPLPHEHEPHTIVGITVGAFLLIFIGTVGLGAFIYHERYANKPHTLDDRYANSESGGCSTSVDDSIGRISYVECSGLDNPRDTYCEEMYNLDNDSFLNSLETVAMPTMLWSVSPHSDSDV